MSKIWNVSVSTPFDPKAPGQHYLAVDDLGSFGTKEAAEAAALKYLADSPFEKVFESTEAATYKLGKQEVHLESIYTSE